MPAANVQYFRWVPRGTSNPIASLIVTHPDYKMTLSVAASVAQVVRETLENCRDMYPAKESTTPGELPLQFVISSAYNWNIRWRDFVTILNETLKLYGKEFQPEV